jgi:hypothetical protein
MYKQKGLAFQYNPSVDLGNGVWYCKSKKLWWKNGTVYDETSASHNGITGPGSQLKKLIARSK